MVFVKICGITSLADGLAATRLGADALGFVFAPSPRRVDPDRARDIISQLPESVITVGVFVNRPVEEISELRGYCGLDVIQLHGDESEEYVDALGGQAIKALRVGNGSLPDLEGYSGCTLLLDTHCDKARGGTGKAFDWNRAVASSKARPVILAGGLSPHNVAEAIGLVRPFGVDVSSGVESGPGGKDHARLARFMAAAKSAAGTALWARPFVPVRHRFCDNTEAPRPGLIEVGP